MHRFEDERNAREAQELTFSGLRSLLTSVFYKSTIHPSTTRFSPKTLWNAKIGCVADFNPRFVLTKCLLLTSSRQLGTGPI